MNEEESIVPIGKEVNCHHGHFFFPSEIYEVRVEDDSVTCRCKDGWYEVTEKDGWIVNKI